MTDRQNDSSAEELLAFWFGELDADGCADEDHSRRWFMKDAAFDRQLEDRFGGELAALLVGEREAWLETAHGRLAYVILIDQLSRNIHRGTPQMFAADHRARAAVREGLAAGQDRLLATDERVFFYMPLMHSEALEDQDRCVELFTALAAGTWVLCDRFTDALKNFGLISSARSKLIRASSRRSQSMYRLPRL